MIKIFSHMTDGNRYAPSLCQALCESLSCSSSLEKHLGIDKKIAACARLTSGNGYAHPSCFKAHVSGQIFVMWRILSPSKSIT